MSRLNGFSALVTGGGRGIGAAAAIALAEAGAKVSVAARNEAQVVKVAGELRAQGHEVFAFRCDVTDPHQVRDLALSAREAMGRIDILVNNAGTATSNPLLRITLAEWRQRFRQAWPQIRPMGFDERFKRLWEFYLHYCEAGFRAGNIDVRQMVYVKAS